MTARRPAPASPAPLPKTGKLPPQRRKNAEVRSREHLLPEEVKKLIKAAATVAGQRYALRDRTLILVIYRHGLRVSEASNLRWEDIDFSAHDLFVRRLKGSQDSNQPIKGDEMRALHHLRKLHPGSPYIFNSERGTPLSPDSIRKIVRRAGEVAGLPFSVHPHMLRHATGYYLANNGVDTRVNQDYLGHKNIHHTVRYTKLASDRFQGIW